MGLHERGPIHGAVPLLPEARRRRWPSDRGEAPTRRLLHRTRAPARINGERAGSAKKMTSWFSKLYNGVAEHTDAAVSLGGEGASGPYARPATAPTRPPPRRCQRSRTRARAAATPPCTASRPTPLATSHAAL